VVVEWLIRGLLGLVLVGSAGGKLLPGGPAKFAAALTAMSGIRGATALRGLLAATVIVELAVAAGLFLGDPSTWLLAGVVLLTLFSAVAAPAIARREQVTCACFGALSARPVDLRLLLRNWALIGLALLAIAIEEAPTMMFAAVSVVALGLLMTQTVLIIQLSRRSASGSAAADRSVLEPPMTGVVVPPVVTTTGERLSADLVLAFLSPGCPSCEDTVDELAAIARDSGLTVAASLDDVDGDPEDVDRLAAMVTGAGIARVANGVDLVQALAVRTFPSFAVVDRSGVVAASCSGTEQLHEIVAVKQRIG
jgi:methylamine utilization protein MauE